MHFVGNTMIDTLVALEERFRVRRRGRATRPRARSTTCSSPCTGPRLVDGPLLPEAIEQLAAVAAELPVVFPVHPRTRKMIEGGLAEVPGCSSPSRSATSTSSRWRRTRPAVLTDSGGIQEETTYLGVPCFTLRDNTERPVTIRAGTNTLLGLDPRRIAEIPELLAGAPRPRGRRPAAVGRQGVGADRGGDRRAAEGSAPAGDIAAALPQR